MKTVGFIIEHENGILGNVINYDNVDNNPIPIDEGNFGGILKYLENGGLIFAMTLALEDNEGKYICPYGVYTDGEWIWPGYYSYYIMSNKMNTIPLEFFNTMKASGFSLPKVPIEKETEATKYFEEILIRNNPNFRKKIKPPSD